MGTTLTREQRSDAYRIYLMVKERDMPSNCTLERLVQRTAIPEARVAWALDFLYAEDAGWIHADVDRRSGRRGYYVDPTCKQKSIMDLESLTTLSERLQRELEAENAATRKRLQLDAEGGDEDDDLDDEWRDIDEDEEDTDAPEA